MGFLTSTGFMLALIVFGVNSCELVFKDCGSKTSKVQAVSFNGTCDGGHAILKKGTDVQMKISLDSNDNSKKLTAVVHGIIAGIPVPFPLKNADACEDCGITCPIQSGKQYIYSPMISVKKSYPSLTLEVKWEVTDDSSKDLFCIVIPAKIIP